MNNLDTIQKLWDDICCGHIFNDGGGTHAVTEWVRTASSMLGSQTTFCWTPTSCTINGVIILVAPVGIIPQHFYNPIQYRTAKNFAVQALNAEMLAKIVVA
jgi:hypothetical protein